MKQSLWLSVLFLFALAFRSPAGGTWVPLANPPPVPIGHFLLLSDGTVMGEAEGSDYGPGWYKLVPDVHGSYVNGTWTNIASMSYTRLDFATEVLQDGRVFVAGGEYGTGKATSEVYNPLSNTWTTVPVPTSLLNPGLESAVYAIPQGFVDSGAVVVSNGDVLISPVGANALGETMIFNPGNNSWSAGPSSAGGQDEASWVKLPDDSILTVDVGSTNAERYIPSLNTWKADAKAPVQLYDTYGSELGPALLLPNGKAIFFGATSHTAIYTPSGTTNVGSWVAGPDFPNAQGMPDSPGAMMVNGKILCAVEHVATNSEEWYPPLSFYEYDYLSNTFTRVSAPVPLPNSVCTNWFNTNNGGSGYLYRPGGGTNFADVSWPALMADLPDGTVLFGHRQRDFYVYVPDGVPLAAGKPSISSITTNADGSLHLTGTLFNGLCQGAAYGDDEQMDSNFPLVRFTDTNGIVRYGRTYNWSSTGVFKTNLVVSVDCTIPAGASTQDFIQVVVNGIASGNNIVETLSDSGPGSLRSVLAYATNGATITFAANLSGQTILLTSGELPITNNVTIDASSLPNGVQINGNHQSSAFSVSGGITATLNALTITNCYAGSNNSGGAIVNDGTFSMNRCTLANNTTDTSAVGGAIYNDGPLTMTACTLSGNTSGFAGAIQNYSTCTLVNCTLAGNSAANGNGGAIDSDFSAVLTLTQCTFYGNTASSVGAGVDNYLATLNVANSILAGDNGYGDIYNWSGSTVNVYGTNIVPSLISAGTNGGTGTVLTSAPLLAPLGNYGGPTPTMPPLAGSPAIDAGSAAVAAGIATDQRGFPRVVGPSVDIGAVEFQGTPVVFTSDSGPGSLRYAVAYSPSGTLVTFASNLSGSSIVLTGGVMSVNNNLTIDGSSLPNGIQIDGNHQSAAFNVSGGIAVTLNGLTITNCYAGTNNSGGAIVNYGTLSMNRCTLANNRTDTSAAGGAIYNAGPLTMTACTLLGNTSGYAGAIQNYSPCTLVNCTLTGNSAANGNGGAIDSDYSAVLTLTQCTFAGNTAAGGGGGGGAVDNYLATLNVANSILAGDSGYGDIYNWPSSTINVYGTNIVPALISAGTNGGTGTVLTSAPLLAPLGNYGGPTQTMPPLAGSPAIDAGSAAVAAGITTDQRGFPRVIGPSVDIGAVEFQGTPVVLTNDSGPGSLRYAVAYCPPGTLVTFASNLSGSSIVLTGGVMSVNNNLTIDASSLPNGVQVNGNHQSPAFSVSGGITATLNGLTITNCYAGTNNSGGAIANYGTLSMNRCTLANNTTDTSAVGGAIYNAGPLTMTACTLSGNTSGFAGAIQNYSPCTLVNCTFTGNSAANGNGGAIDSDFSAVLTLTQCTFFANTTVGAGGAVDNYLATLNVANSILAGDSGGGDIYNWSGSTVNVYGTNIVPSLLSAGTNGGTGTVLTSAPLLASLGNYGGPTQTMPPLRGSPAIDGGSPAFAAGIVTDQRGYPRVSGLRVDIGAVEAQIASTPPVLDNDALSGGSGNATFQFGFTNLMGGSFTVLASTNVAQPLGSWTDIGPAVEVPPGSGQFQFHDPQATNYTQRFYRVGSP